MTEGQQDKGNGGQNEDKDDDAEVLAYYITQGPYVQPNAFIPEAWVASRIALPLAQLHSCSSNQVRMMDEEVVMMLQESISRYGYRETRNSVAVQAPPRTADAVPAVDPGSGQVVSHIYEVLDGHHRFAAVLALQARNLLSREYALPVIVIRDTVPRENLYAYQCFVNLPIGHTNESADYVFANVNRNI